MTGPATPPFTPGRHDLPVSSLHPSERNPRRITDEAFERLKYTLTKRPDLMEARPLIALTTGEVIAGNMRLRAIRDLGWDTVPVHVGDYTDDERREAVTLDNQPFGEWVPDELAMLVAEHERAGGDVALLGFADTEVQDLLNRASGDDDPPLDRDAPSDDVLVDVPQRAAYGDVWRLGDHALIVGNALDTGSYAALGTHAPPPRGIALVVTSPPYNQKIETFKPSGMHKEGPAVIHRLAGAYDDSKPEPEYQDDQVRLLNLLAEQVAPNASLFYNHKIRYRDKRAVHPLDWLRRAADTWALRQEIVWDRGMTITLNARMFNPTDERIYWLTCGPDFAFANTTEIKSYSSVWSDIGVGGEYKVSAPFPVELPTRAIKACSVEGDVVLDPYLGTGTTLMAAEHLGRSCRGIEINPRYADVVIARWEAYTGQTAERVATTGGDDAS